ncbi:hypothetical protein GYMLUDRAFT_139256, partial [Collybiopsis luxurians FD-317 M1]
CSQCWVSHSVSNPLKRCTGCFHAKYCIGCCSLERPFLTLFIQSETCQKRAWPAHKAACHENREKMSTWSPEHLDVLSALSKFIAKHTPMIGQSAIRAFTLHSRPEQALQEFMVIKVTDHRHLFPNNRIRCETAFYITDASVHE